MRLSAGGNAKDGINDRGPPCFELVIRWWFANGFLVPRPDEEEILNPGLFGNENATDAQEENGRRPGPGVDGVQKSNPRGRRHHHPSAKKCYEPNKPPTSGNRWMATTVSNADTKERVTAKTANFYQAGSTFRLNSGYT